MTHLEDSIVIRKPVDEVYQRVCDVESHPKLMTYFRECKIIKKDGNKITVNRVAEIGGKIRSWVGEITFKPEKKSFDFKQIDGPLKGMTGEWACEPTSEGTKLIILHNINFNIPIFGKLVELYVANKFVSKSARDGLKSIKNIIEKG